MCYINKVDMDISLHVLTFISVHVTNTNPWIHLFPSLSLWWTKTCFAGGGGGIKQQQHHHHSNRSPHLSNSIRSPWVLRRRGHVDPSTSVASSPLTLTQQISNFTRAAGDVFLSSCADVSVAVRHRWTSLVTSRKREVTPRHWTRRGNAAWRQLKARFPVNDVKNGGVSLFVLAKTLPPGEVTCLGQCLRSLGPLFVSPAAVRPPLQTSGLQMSASPHLPPPPPPPPPPRWAPHQGNQGKQHRFRYSLS